MPSAYRKTKILPLRKLRRGGKACDRLASDLGIGVKSCEQATRLAAALFDQEINAIEVRLEGVEGFAKGVADREMGAALERECRAARLKVRALKQRLETFLERSRGVQAALKRGTDQGDAPRD
jgi:hypothetical protein